MKSDKPKANGLAMLDGMPIAAGSQLVMFGVPSKDHRVTLEHMQSSRETEWLLAQHRIPHGVIALGGNNFVDRARNAIVYQFLAKFSMATDLFWLDDDIGWPAEKVIEFLKRPEDVVFGAYPKKADTPGGLEYPVELELKDGALVEQRGYYKAITGATGFMRIKRHVLEHLASVSRRYMEPLPDGTKEERFNIFEAGLPATMDDWIGEDACLFLKGRAAGFSFWLDPNIKFTHRGHKLWHGNFNDTLNRWKESGALQQDAVKAPEAVA